MRDRPRAFAVVAAGFWLGFLPGLATGVLAGLRVARAQSHIFSDFSTAAKAAAVARAGWLYGLGLGLAGAALAALALPVLRRLPWRPPIPWPRALAGLGAAAVLLGLPAVALDLPPRGDGAPGNGRPNLVLIVVDALRSDRLGCYGYDRPTSPHLDALCRRSVVFEQAVVQYPATGPSFGSIFTAKYPRRHGLSAMDPRAWIGGEFNRTLAEILAEEGYTTAAVMTGSITRSSGLARGFAEVFEELPAHALHRVDSAWPALRSRLRLSRSWVRWRRGLDRDIVVTVAERWLARVGHRPFFLFLHLYQPHSPYDPPAEHLALFDPDYAGPHRAIGTRMLRRVRAGDLELETPAVDRLNALYDAEVRAADEAVGRFLTALDRAGLRDDTVVVMTADHGEELYDHRLVEHGHIYNTNLLVPLILDLPAGSPEGRRVPGPVELLDLMPTLLDLVGAPIPDGIDGELLPLDETAAPSEAYAFAEADCQSFGGRATDCWLSIQSERWKLDRNLSRGKTRLFDLATDPLEREDVAALHPEVATELEARLLAWNATQPDLPALRQELSDSGRREIEERLRALGYID